MPSPDDEGETFCKKVMDRLKSVRTSPIKKGIIDCGEDLNSDGEFNAMIINLTLLSIEMDEMNDTNI